MNKKTRHIPFHQAYITEEDISEVIDVLKSGWITSGRKCFEFEKAFAEYLGCKHAVAVNSCTAALHLALEAVGLREREIVLTSPMTFAATAEVIRYFNAKPVFVDIEPETMNIDTVKLEETIKLLAAKGEKAKAVIPIHFGGHPCDMDSIMSIANTFDMRVIEDAAHVLPGKYHDRNIGTIGDLTCFSFYATKNITTGEGGMAVTENDAWAERMRIMSLHGISKDAWMRYTAEGSWFYDIIAPGYKYNLTDIAAALGLIQLKKADIFQKRREEIASQYNNAFKNTPQIDIPITKDHIQHSWHLYVIKLNLGLLTVDRSQIIEELKKRGVGTSVHFIPLHIHSYYRDTYGYNPGDFPVAYESYSRIITLPIYPKMTDEDIRFVSDNVIDVISTYSK